MIVAVLAASAAHAAPPGSMQAMFDSAQESLDTGKFWDAERGFRALQDRALAAPKPNPRTLAAARLGLGEARAGLGDEAGAIALYQQALPVFVGPGDEPVRHRLLQALGRAEEAGLDWAPAQQHYREALALTPPEDARGRIATRIMVARTSMFDDPARTATDLEAGLSEAEATLAKEPGPLSSYYALYGRALMNADKVKDARVALDRALKLSGGLKLTAHLSDIVIRNDAALAAQLDGDLSEAINYTVYTGAGREAKSSLKPPTEGQPPACGGAADVKPDDLAVVQFSIGNDGSVISAIPIYASRPGPMAIEFARAVRGWSWSPEATATIAPFFRTAARLELRCTTRAERRSTEDLLLPDVRDWVAKLPGGETFSLDPADDTVQRATALRARLAQGGPAGGGDPVALLPTLMTLAASKHVDQIETNALWTRADAIVRAAHAPVPVIAWTAIRRAITNIVVTKRLFVSRFDPVAPLLGDPAIPAGSRARAGVLLVGAERSSYRRTDPRAIALLGEALATPPSALPEGDPIRQAAAIRLASLQAAAGDRASAETTYRTGGLAPDQCALLDAEPVPVSRAVSSNDYPDKMLRLDFRGWAKTEFDVLATGKTQKQRTIIAYPPFLFGDTANRVLKRFVFRPTFRPEGAISCGGYQFGVSFVIPDHP